MTKFKLRKSLLILFPIMFALIFDFDAKAENIISAEDTVKNENIQDAVATKKKKKKKKKPVKYNEKGEIIKTGWNLGPLPVIAFDADKGFQLGALLNLFDFGDGSTYPNPRQHWYFEASFFTKGSQLYTVSYDNKFSIPGVRISSTLTLSNDKAMDFYGYNGYKSFYDFDKIKAGKKGESFIYTPYYKVDRLALLFKCDFIGNIWNNKFFWEAGYHLSWFDQDPINRAKINKNKKPSQVYPDELPTLYEQYKDWGIIRPNEIGGGFNSSIRLGLLYDSRDKEGAPTRGIWAEAHATIAPKWLGTKVPFYKYSITFRHYVPIVKNDILTFAYRLNYEGTFGNQAPHYVLPYITVMGASYDRDGMGGYRTIRGMIRDRVVGLDMASYNAEFRWRFVKFKLWKQNISFALSVFSDGSMVTREYNTAFQSTRDDFESEEAFINSKKAYDEFMAKGNNKELPHITAGGGLRFIMNENFIVCFEYGLPVTRLRHQDGGGAFYINTGYLF